MVHLIKIVLLLNLVHSAVSSKCIKLRKRRAWHTLHHSEKKDYIDAELCLMSKPAKYGLPGARTRFDELQSVHQQQGYANHFVAAFLPFHRLFMYAHETALREECGYTGHQPYWEETIDAGHFLNATTSIFSPTHGFGGDGDLSLGGVYDPTLNATTGCLSNGPFKDYINTLGPGYEITNHCITRQINDTFSFLSSKSFVDQCLAMEEWEDFWHCLESAPHAGGHGGVNGEMLNGVSSPGDPLFWLHHTWLDKIWWDWQHLNTSSNHSRFTTISGTNVMPDVLPDGAIFPTRPANIPQPTGAAGDPGRETTLGHILNMYGNVPNRTIGEVLNTAKGFLCYEYIEK